MRGKTLGLRLALSALVMGGLYSLGSFLALSSEEHSDLASIASSASPTRPSCDYPLMTEPLTPQSLQEFIHTSQISSIRDLVCCLPENYRRHYVVVHSSFALQAGVPDNPRVLLYGVKREDSANSAPLVLSISGSRLATHSSDHVEAFFRNEQEKKNELYDFDFSQRQARIEKNPMVCMGCHSPSHNEFEIAGAKPVFQSFPWPSMVGMSLHLDDSETKKYFQQIETHALKALSVDPNYACLQPASLEQLAANAATFDGFMAQQNNERVAQLIEHSKNYEQIKPLLAGVAAGCFSQTPLPSKEDLDFFDQEITRWIPAEKLDSTFYDDHWIMPSLRSVDNMQQALQNLIVNTEAAEQAIRTERRQRSSLGRQQALFFPHALFSALYKDDLSEFREIAAGEIDDQSPTGPPKTLQGYRHITQLLARYALDSLFRPHFGKGIDSYLRFLFEARGISTLTWTQEMAGGYGSDLVVPLEQLRQNESGDPVWKATCQNLRTESFHRF